MRITHADGLVGLVSGDLPRARTPMEEALEVFGARGDLASRVWMLMILGLVYELQGMFPGQSAAIGRFCT